MLVNTLSVCRYVLFNISWENLFSQQEYPLIEAFLNSHYLFAWQIIDIVIGRILSFSTLNFYFTFLVNGNWAAWGEWGICSKTCGGGYRRRDRTCTNPAPHNGGLVCQGSSFQLANCNIQLCPGNEYVNLLYVL